MCGEEVLVSLANKDTRQCNDVRPGRSNHTKEAVS